VEGGGGGGVAVGGGEVHGHGEAELHAALDEVQEGGTGLQHTGAHHQLPRVLVVLLLGLLLGVDEGQLGPGTELQQEVDTGVQLAYEGVAAGPVPVLYAEPEGPVLVGVTEAAQTELHPLPPRAEVRLPDLRPVNHPPGPVLAGPQHGQAGV